MKFISIKEKTEAQIKALTWTNFTVKSGENNGYPVLEWEITE